MEIHRCRFVEHFPSGVSCLALNVECSLLAVGRNDASIEIWNIQRDWIVEKVTCPSSGSFDNCLGCRASISSCFLPFFLSFSSFFFLLSTFFFVLLSSFFFLLSSSFLAFRSSLEVRICQLRALFGARTTVCSQLDTMPALQSGILGRWQRNALWTPMEVLCGAWP